MDVLKTGYYNRTFIATTAEDLLRDYQESKEFATAELERHGESPEDFEVHVLCSVLVVEKFDVSERVRANPSCSLPGRSRELFELLHSRPGEIFPWAEILDHMGYRSRQTLCAAIKRLRKDLEDRHLPYEINYVYMVGYVLRHVRR